MKIAKGQNPLHQFPRELLLGSRQQVRNKLYFGLNQSLKNHLPFSRFLCVLLFHWLRDELYLGLST